MEVNLEIASGPQAGEKAPIEIGCYLLVGRSVTTDIRVTGDLLMSESHFAFWWDENGCCLQDLQSAHGTFLNGRTITYAAARNGDEITAGKTRFVVRVEGRGGVPTTIALGSQTRELLSEAPNQRSRAENQTQGLLNVLRSQPEPLLAILDAAKDPKVLEILRYNEQPYQSLYEGSKGKELARFAPYLVELTSASLLLEILVRVGWGKSWGIYLTSRADFKEVRRHLRRFLLVQAEDGRKLYFRFYDPRVLRVFLPTCNAQQAVIFFGPVRHFMVESQNARALLEFTHDARGVESQSVPLLRGSAAIAR
jgi:pSer/pThr/pTyr-binding forkhead associated (FHA) protein